MREGTVGVSHPVRVFALLDGLAAAVDGIHEFAAAALLHGVFAALAGGFDEPADGQRLLAIGTHRDRHLVGGATDAARAYLHRRADVVERGVERGDRILAALLLHDVEGPVDDRFGGRLLAVFHERVHEFGDDDVAKLGVGDDFALFGGVTTGHGFFLPLPGYDRGNSFGSSLLRALGAVLRPALLAILDALGVEHAAEHVVTHAGQVAHAPAADQHHRVLLQVVTFAGDVGDHLALIGQADLGNLSQGRIRLLRRRRVDAGAHTALLRIGFHGRNLVPPG